MTSERILQIVPRCQGAPSGVGDYAVRVAKGLRTQSGIETVFLSGTPGEGGKTAGAAVAVRERTAKALTEALVQIETHSPFGAIVVHLSGYGFAQRGAPFWLADGLARWRQQRPRARIVTVFHELYATGKPWRSSFWLGPLQKAITRRIWQLSDHALTTNLPYARDLASWRPDAAHAIVTMPVFSTVGESCEIAPYHSRARAAVVFGSAGVETSIYEVEAAAIEQCVARLKITEVIDIGVRRRPLPAAIAGAPVNSLGRQPSEEIGRLLADCRIGLIAYDISRLGKSTIFAAYAAHGVVPVCLGPEAEPSDGIVADRHFLRPPLPDGIEQRLVSMQRDVVSWYRDHDVSRLIVMVAGMCRGLYTSESCPKTVSVDLDRTPRPSKVAFDE